MKCEIDVIVPEATPDVELHLSLSLEEATILYEAFNYRILSGADADKMQRINPDESVSKLRDSLRSIEDTIFSVMYRSSEFNEAAKVGVARPF